MSTPHRILFVCYGNIMRSAFAEAVFQSEIRRLSLEDVASCSSAGVRAAPGEAAEPNAARIAQKLGYSLKHHSATRTNRHNVADHTAIYLMDKINYDLLTREFPEAKSKVAYLSQLDPQPGGPFEIADPYLEADQTLELCFRRIERSVKALAQNIAQSR